MVGEEFPGGADGSLAGFAAGSRVAGYRLEEQIGSGGMAVVFRARDERLDRLVALKILAPALAADEGFRHRFIRESRAAAAVDDPHIIPVHEAGEAGKVLFIAMRYVPGGDAATRLRRDGPMSPGRAMAIVSPVASALDAAHAAGLVHRDVKPANMLMDVRAGRPDHVYLSDFGLSKEVLSVTGLTGSGQFLGSLDYCAPEQIQGRAVDGRADQYALACTTVELLTGAPPFPRDQATAVIWAHMSQPPPPVTSRRPDLPTAADQVFARALAKAPGDRYASCQEFAAALRETFGLAPYDAAPDAVAPAGHPLTGNAGRDARKTEDAVSAAADGAAGTVTNPTGPPAETTGPAADDVRMPAEVAPAASEPARRSRHRELRRVALLGAGVLVLSGIVTVVTLGTSSHASPPRPRLIRTFAPAGAGKPAIYSVAFSPSGQILAGTYSDGRTYLWNVTTGHLTTALADPHTGEYGVYAVTFSPDGQTLAAGDSNDSTYLWDVATRHLTATLPNRGATIYAVAFSPSGKILAAGDYNGRTYLWDVATRRLIATLTDPHTGSYGVDGLAFTPDGKILATGDTNGRTYLWDVATRRLIATLTDPHTGKYGVFSVALSPDGQTLAVGDTNDRTYLWSMASKRITATLVSPAAAGYGVTGVAFSPDGQTVAAGDSNGRTYLWDAATGRLIATLAAAHPGKAIAYAGVYAVAFSPDGTMLAVSNSNGTASLWDVG